MWCAQYLPLMATFGFSHSARVFLVLAVFIFLAPKLDLLFSGRLHHQVRRIQYVALLSGIILLISLMARYKHVFLKSEEIHFFYYAAATWQLFLIAILCFYTKIYSTPQKLFFFSLAELMISVFTVVPISGLTRTPPSTYDRFAKQFYESNVNDHLLIPASKSEVALDIDVRTELNAIKIIPRRNFPSHTHLDTFYHYINNTSRFNKLLSLPFVFASNGQTLEVNRIKLAYNSIEVDVTTEDSCQMVIQQTFYKRWRAEQPGNTPTAYDGVLLQTALKKGENKVRLFYYSKDLIIEAVISLLMLSILGIVIINQYRKQLCARL
jgi:hypothetical protein